MDTEKGFTCRGCDHLLESRENFCIQCGRLSPALLERGDMALRLMDIPSQQLRETIVRLLASWFPSLDRISAEHGLASGSMIIVQGISEQSGERILDTLKRFRVHGELIPVSELKPGFSRFLNLGWILPVLTLLLSLVTFGKIPFWLVLLSLPAPFLWGFLAPKQVKPLVPTWEARFDVHLWESIAKQYEEVAARAEQQLLQTLGDIADNVFLILQYLSTDSLTAVAAGGQEGELSARVTEVLRTAIALTQRIGVSSGEEEKELRKELGDLAASIQGTRLWLENKQKDQVTEVSVLTRELNEATQSIDRILRDVRSGALSHERVQQKELL